MEEFVDYYEILELEKNAPIEEIEERLRKHESASGASKDLRMLCKEQTPKG